MRFVLVNKSLVEDDEDFSELFRRQHRDVSNTRKCFSLTIKINPPLVSESLATF